MELIEDYAQFFTATIKDWKPVLESNEAKKLIVDSLAFLHDNHRALIYGFVIMDNHIHLIWQMREGHKLKDVQRDFLKFTAQQLKFYLQKRHPSLLYSLKVDSRDREYQVWQRNSLSTPLYSRNVFDQKLDYLHSNPVRKGFCNSPSDYFYSFARFYENGDEIFHFLRHPN